MEKIIVGLIKGRHEMPVSEYIIDEIDNVLDFDEAMQKIGEFIDDNFKLRRDSYGDVCTDKELVVYVTGLTYVTATLVALCARNNINLTLMHFDSLKGKYVPQQFSFTGIIL